MFVPLIRLVSHGLKQQVVLFNFCCVLVPSMPFSYYVDDDLINGFTTKKRNEMIVFNSLAVPPNSTLNPSASVVIEGNTIGRTATLQGDTKPIFGETFVVRVLPNTTRTVSIVVESSTDTQVQLTR
jgi:hypothetical protein